MTTSASTFSENVIRSGAEPSRLAALLDAELDYSAEARGGFVNHLPMTLVAAARLGAPDARLEEIYRSHTGEDFLLKRKRPGWLAERTREVIHQDISSAVQAGLPPLLAALDARWFHALIRLEHAVDAGHAAQVAHALGDWEQVGRPLPDLPAPRGTATLVEVARRIEATKAAPSRKQRIREVANQASFAEALGRARGGPHALEDAVELALHAHVAGRNITTLHLVTGACAAAELAKLLPRSQAHALGERLGQAILAGYLSGGSGRLPSALALEELRSREVPSWSILRDAGVATDDPHVTKLVYACLRQEGTTGDRLYPWIAARACGLLRSTD